LFRCETIHAIRNVQEWLRQNAVALDNPHTAPLFHNKQSLSAISGVSDARGMTKGVGDDLRKAEGRPIYSALRFNVQVDGKSKCEAENQFDEENP
jgi:hypothetical protein